ncbi:oxygen-independent coproporphyrinogen III oxidase [Larkinella terrae]|uniref:Coproporphyrinogen-III oxidase n=1 Tax=Larkinella terrae TaxID=2025311 RepID=A0A7K0ECH5_9BACT|nr:oxygen-independent coproporphyrinogen III oxidase [Larkinella terrae]MRS59669.1 oxygen-independent coproporphyrinogen III oxidase [Larkinella terrae]
MTDSLITKYNVAGPRYTSYPTVPFWDTATFNPPEWRQRLTNAFGRNNDANGISLYIHLPYCESLCTFCGCNKRITRNHAVEKPYIDTLLAEWALYCDQFPQRPRIAELHLGGGTPSFFSPQQLRRLLTGIFRWADPTDEPDYGWEGHPGNTTREHLQTLYEFGFRRISFGVQDYDPQVQLAIHRFQPAAQVRLVTELARTVGYTSISHDLVFGLPFQCPETIRETVLKTLTMRPDRISFYSYAHVPWIKGNGQRGFRDEDLPSGDSKRKLYEIGCDLLQTGGYREIGMDHFSLPHDPLYKAQETGQLHRNFMGYTLTQTSLLIGLGVSAIGDAGTAFMQNEKDLESYRQRVLAGEFPVLRGHLLTRKDAQIRRMILEIMCRSQTAWERADWTNEEWGRIRPQLADFQADGLIRFDDTSLRVLPAGRPFLRNICMVFDHYLTQNRQTGPLFSQTV